MPDGDEVVGGARLQFVDTGDVTFALRGDGGVELGPCVANHLLQRKSGARRGVLLAGMVDLGDGQLVAMRADRKLVHQPQHHLHAHRKVRTVEQTGVPPLAKRAHVLQVVVPAGRADHNLCAAGETGAHVVNDRLRRGEVDHGVHLRQQWRRQRRSIPVLFLTDDANTVAALMCNVGNDGARLAPAKNQEDHRLPPPACATARASRSLRASRSKMEGSGSAKKTECSERIASSTSSSSIIKLILISDAPWEIMRRLMCRSAPKTCAAMPFWPRMFSPTMQIKAFRPSYFTSANLRRSAAISGRRSLESTVSETLTSEVETMSTEHLYRSKTSKTAFR